MTDDSINLSNSHTLMSLFNNYFCSQIGLFIYVSVYKIKKYKIKPHPDRGICNFTKKHTMKCDNLTLLLHHRSASLLGTRQNLLKRKVHI